MNPVIVEPIPAEELLDVFRTDKWPLKYDQFQIGATLKKVAQDEDSKTFGKLVDGYLDYCWNGININRTLPEREIRQGALEWIARFAVNSDFGELGVVAEEAYKNAEKYGPTMSSFAQYLGIEKGPQVAQKLWPDYEKNKIIGKALQLKLEGRKSTHTSIN